MPNYNFRSVGSAISDELAKVMAEREAMKRQTMLDQIAQQREARLVKSDADDAEYKRELIAGQREARVATGKMNAETIRGKQIETAGKLYKPNQVLEEAQKATVPAELQKAQMTLPATSLLTPKSIEQTPSPTGQTTFTGTVDQQQQEAFLSDPNVPQAAKQAILAGVKPTAEMLTGPKKQDVFSVAPNKQSILRLNTTTGAFEPYVGGDIPKDAHWLNQGQEQGGGDSRPYFIPVTTGEGLKTFNARTGRYEGDTQPLRPGATAESDLARGGSMLYAMDRLAKQFNRDWVGPIAGRYNTMQLALVGEAGETGLASMTSMLANLQNTVINLRTGAQMSEPEAQRILNEIPGMNQPPDVFIAKLNTTREYFEDWYKRREALAYGRPEQLPPVPGVSGGITTGSETPEQRRARIIREAQGGN